MAMKDTQLFIRSWLKWFAIFFILTTGPILALLLTNKSVYVTPFLQGPLRWLWYTLHLLMMALVSNLWVHQLQNRAIRKAHEKEIRQIYKRNELLLSSSGDGIYGLDLDGKVTFVNPAAEKILGRTASEMIGGNSHTLFHHSYANGTKYPAEKCPVCVVLQEGSTMRIESEVFWHKDGTALPVSYHISPIIDAGEVKGAVVIFQDIREKLTREEQLQRERQKYKNILDLAAEGLFILDPYNSRLVEWFGMVPKMLGYTPEEVKELTVLDWDKGFNSITEFRSFASRIGFDPINFERVHTRKDGSTYDATISAVRIPMDADELLFVSARDITEQKRRIAEHLAREAQLRTITDTSHDAIIMMNPQGQISFWNPAAEKITGYTAEEAMGRDLHRLIVPKQHWPHFDAGFAGFLKSGKGKVIGQTLEHMVVHKDGHQIPISVSLASVLLDSQWHAVGVIRDDTGRHQAMEKEEKLRREERSLLSLFDKGDTLLFKWNNDNDLSTAYVSENVGSFLGVDKQQFINGEALYSSCIHPDDFTAFTEKFRSAVRADLDYFTHQPYRVVTRNGTVRWILNHTVTQKNSAGEITHFIGYLSDITSQKQIEERTRELKEEFETIFNTVPIPIAYINDQGAIYRRNRAYVQLTGYDKQDVANSYDWMSKAFPDKAYRKKAVALWQGHVEEAQKSGGLIKSDLYMVTCKDGAVRPLAAGGRIIKGGLIATLIDMSEEENAKQALIKAREQADSASLAKSRFLANMSHEFRTPLNSVIGLTQMLAQRQGLDPEVREEVDNIHTAGQMLLSLVNDILDLSKIEAGEINLEMVPMQLESVLRELRALLVSQVQKKGLELIIGSLPAATEGYVISDPTRLRQMLLNLLNNAIKFTSNGSVSLSVEPAGPVHISDEGSRHERLRFLVKDTGCGIQADILPTLFNAFRQADSSITRRYGGTGLGLAIVKQLCGELGGDVYVESVVGEGSCFTIELPFRIATDEEVKAAGLYRKQFHILLAEDDPDHRNSLVTMCAQLGWDVEAVPDGRELLRRYQELLDEEQQIDCLVVDWQMPELDGLEALFEIREKFGAEGIPGVLMVTGYETERLKKSPHAEIADLILSKPLTVSALVNGLGLVFNKHHGDLDLVLRSSTLDFAHLSWLPEVKILIVDDAQVNLDLASRLFAREGAVVATCTNGAEALEWLLSPGNSADIVLMDIQMPVMDGNTAVREIRRIESLKELPVIALTAAALASERKISLEAGMDDYQTKPFDTEKMVRLIRRYVGIAKGIPVPVREKQVKRVESLTWPAIEGIEMNGVRERVNDDLELFMVLLNGFSDANRDLLAPLALSQEQPARDVLQARMHKLAGSAGLIGANALSGLAKRVENSLRDGDYWEIPALPNQLKEMYYQLNEAVASVLLHDQKESSKAEPMVLTRVELDELHEALQQKKISAVQIYRKLRPALRPSMTEKTYKGLDEAMVKLDFTAARKWLAQLTTAPAAERSAEQDGEV
jgi:PAS domain S-box-containing protein